MITDALGNPHPSSLPGGSWPNVLFGEAAEIELLQTQFRITERSDPAVIRTLQNTQIVRLAKHAHSTSSFWRQRLLKTQHELCREYSTRAAVGDH